MPLYLAAAAALGYSLWSPSGLPAPALMQRAKTPQMLNLGDVVIYDLQMEEMMEEQKRKLAELDEQLNEAEAEKIKESERAAEVAREAEAAAQEAQKELVKMNAELDEKSQELEDKKALVETLLANLGAEKAAFREEMEGEKLRRRRLQELIADLKQGLQSERETGARFKNALDEIAKVMETASVTPTETRSM